MMKKKQILKLALSGLLIYSLAGCNSNDLGRDNEQEITDSSDRPDTEVREATIYLYNQGQVTAEVDADLIHKFEVNDSTMGYNLNIDLLDSSGNVTSTIVGDSGVIWENIGEFQIFGHVVVDSDDDSQLETDYLTWNSDTKKMHTDAFVRVTDADGVVLTGWGMEAEQNPTRYRILQQVSGTFKEKPDSGR